MVIGMTIVFAFLLLLMAAVKAMGVAIQNHFSGPKTPAAPSAPSAPSAAKNENVPAPRKVAPAILAIARKPVSANDQGAIVAAISTAIAMHRRQQTV